MRSILFLAPRVPLPADTGAKIRTLNLLRQLRRGVQPHLVCPTSDSRDAEGATLLRRQGFDVTLVPVLPGQLAYWNGLVPGRPPIAIAKYASRRLGRTLCELARARAYAGVHCDHLHMAQYQPELPGLSWVLDEHNVEHVILERLAQLQGNPVRRWLVSDQARRMRRFEHWAVGRASKVLTVSANDAVTLARLGTSTAIEVVPNGVDTSYFSESPSETTSADLVFTGSMDWWPNEDAATYFAHEVLPLIRRTCPQVRFVIVGRAPSARLRRLAKRDDAILVTGAVDDVRPYLSSAAAVVVPIRLGGGTRLKILEAMAMGRAVVSTTVGAEGINCRHGEQIAIADTASDFASATLGLLADRQTGVRLGRAARRFVVEQYDWDLVGRKLLTAHGVAE